jgi:hypothetical protein
MYTEVSKKTTSFGLDFPVSGFEEHEIYATYEDAEEAIKSYAFEQWQSNRQCDDYNNPCKLEDYQNYCLKEIIIFDVDLYKIENWKNYFDQMNEYKKIKLLLIILEKYGKPVDNLNYIKDDEDFSYMLHFESAFAREVWQEVIEDRDFFKNLGLLSTRFCFKG